MKNRGRIAKKIKQARIERNMSVADVSKATGVAVSVISKFENGRKADESKLKLVLDFLEIEEDASMPINDDDWMTDHLKFMMAVPRNKEHGEFICPLCGSTARFRKSPINGHLHVICNGCLTKVIQ